MIAAVDFVQDGRTGNLFNAITDSEMSVRQPAFFLRALKR